MINRTLQVKLQKPTNENGLSDNPAAKKVVLKEYEQFAHNILKDVSKGIAMCILLHGVTKVAVALAER